MQHTCMNVTLYGWTFNFHKVVQQQNSGAVEDFILPYSAVYLRIQKRKNYWNRSTFAKVIVKIKVAPFYGLRCSFTNWWNNGATSVYGITLLLSELNEKDRGVTYNVVRLVWLDVVFIRIIHNKIIRLYQSAATIHSTFVLVMIDYRNLDYELHPSPIYNVLCCSLGLWQFAEVDVVFLGCLTHLSRPIYK